MPTRFAHQRSDRDARGGLDGKVVGWDRFTFDLTANPDFSHVEADDPQVTINQRYEVYFPEKRPFFIENAGTFQTPETLFFSRRIISPRLGTRVTARQADGWLGHSWLQGQAARSFDERIAETTGGTAAVIELTRADRHLTFVNRYLERSPDFVAQLGFIPCMDIRQAFQLASSAGGRNQRNCWHSVRASPVP